MNLPRLPFACALAWLGAVVALSPLSPQAAELSEYELKAALLYRLTRFIHWPKHTFANGDGRLNICVLGQDPFGSALDAIEGKRSHGLEVHVQRHMNVGPTAESCHVVFVSPSEAGRINDILDRLADRPILTMGDDAQFVEAGGLIGLGTTGEFVAISVNLEACERSGLTIGAEILQLASLVRGARR